MLYTTQPPNFKPIFEIVACYCIYQDKIILLHRHSHKSEGDKWGPPAGKVEPNEKLTQAILRELKEETELSINKNQLTYLKKILRQIPGQTLQLPHLHYKIS